MSAEDKLRNEIKKCQICDACKGLLDFSCPVFDEIFRLIEHEGDAIQKISTHQLRHLVELCNFCAACPCSDIRAAIINAKTEYIDKYGLNFGIRALENIECLGKLGSMVPQLTNLLLQNEITGDLIKRAMGIHKDCKFPSFPREDFEQWLRKRQNKHVGSSPKERKKVAYFAGCSARYFFPEVAKAVVQVLERNGIEVFYLEQQCCGIPAVLEGDRKLSLKFARFNVARIAEAVKDGYHIVCSCPTCGFMLRHVLRAGALDRSEYLESQNPADGFLKKLPEALLETMLRDDGYFSSINPKTRKMVADNTYDLGEYLGMLHMHGELDTKLSPISVSAAYYPPCHLRKQRIGSPYQYLLSLIPGFSVETIGGNYCCGNAGIMGFKREFHHQSIKIASRLLARIRRLHPELIVTDCLSCLIQFNHLTSYNVLHPIQIINEAYKLYQEETVRKAG